MLTFSQHIISQHIISQHTLLLLYFCNSKMFFCHIVFLPHLVIIIPQLYIQSQVAILQQLYIQLWFFCHTIISILIVRVLRGGGVICVLIVRVLTGSRPHPLIFGIKLFEKNTTSYIWNLTFRKKHEVNSENFSAKNFRQKSLIKFIMIYYHLY